MSDKARRTYTRAFKIETVKLLETEGRTMVSVGRELSIHPNTLTKWKAEYGTRGAAAFPGKGVRAEPVSDLDAAQRKIEALERELERVRSDHDILKKAVGIFSRRST